VRWRSYPGRATADKDRCRLARRTPRHGGKGMKYSEIYRGSNLTCMIERRCGQWTWACHIDGRQSMSGGCTAREALVPSAVLAEAVQVGRCTIDCMIKGIAKSRKT
jgi:hypothetical protein